jgi:glycosyltransferase involved in cell wall biosynthesis
VIVPTYNRAKVLQTALLGIAAQKYPNIEVIVVDDGSNDDTEKVVMEFKKLAKIPVKYLKQSKDGYGLARARNNGVVEAFGDILVFQDDRFVMDRDAVNNFVDKLKHGSWLFGDKGANKKSFVENFSCVYKKDLVNMGMFNERMVYYGGMTRDLISRMRTTGVHYQYVPEAKCQVLLGSKSRFTKKDEIYRAKLLLWKLGGGK